MQLGRLPRIGRILAAIFVLVAALSVPAVAAAKVTVPPGSTEGDQYFEEVPNGGGSGSPNHAGGGGGGGGTTGGSAGVVAADQSLRALGADGQAAADLADANRPPTGGSKPGGSASATQPASSSTEGEGGMGIFFPLLIAGTSVAAIAYGLRRRLYPT